MKIYRCQPLADLSSQLLFAPHQRRIEQVRRAEILHDEIEPQTQYPFEYLAFRLTAYRVEMHQDAILPGEMLLPDLRLLIDTLSRSAPAPPDPDDPVETAQQLSGRLKVSTKTLDRWRKLGLRRRWAVINGSTDPVVVYPTRAVEYFAVHNPLRFSEAGSLTRLDSATRADLIRRARRMAKGRDVSLNHVARHLAKRTGRALETIRLLLEKHDRQNPQERIFIDYSAPLSVHQKRVIARAYRMGVSPTKMARRFRRTRATIHRAIRQRRAADLKQDTLRFFVMPAFLREDADEIFLNDGDTEISSPEQAASVSAVPVGDLPESIKPIFRQEFIEPDRQQTLLVRMNYMVYRASTLVQGLDRYDPRQAGISRIEELLNEAKRIRARLVATHMPTVLLSARQHAQGTGQPSAALLELLEIGMGVAGQAIDDYEQTGNRMIDGYVHWAIVRRFASLSAMNPPASGFQQTPSGPGGEAQRAHRRDSMEVLTHRILRAARTLGLKVTNNTQQS